MASILSILAAVGPLVNFITLLVVWMHSLASIKIIAGELNDSANKLISVLDRSVALQQEQLRMLREHADRLARVETKLSEQEKEIERARNRVDAVEKQSK